MYTAKELLRLPPFSQERKILLNKGYELIDTIWKWRNPGASSYGASDGSAGLVCKFLKRMKNPVMLYEAGTGTGFSAGMFMKYPNVSMRGCDVVVPGTVKDLMREYPGRLSVEEATLYDSLKGLEDGSIDIFYADNVFEHLFPDEFPEIMKILVNKLKRGALLFLFIPNRLYGPNDDSRFFLKMGQKAQGFHFMEQSYRDVTAYYAKWGIVPAYSTYMIYKKVRCIKDSRGIISRFKLFLEDAAKHLPPFLRGRVMRRLGLSSYILVKK